MQTKITFLAPRRPHPPHTHIHIDLAPSLLPYFSPSLSLTSPLLTTLTTAVQILNNPLITDALERVGQVICEVVTVEPSSSDDEDDYDDEEERWTLQDGSEMVEQTRTGTVERFAFMMVSSRAGVRERRVLSVVCVGVDEWVLKGRAWYLGEMVARLEDKEDDDEDDDHGDDDDWEDDDGEEDYEVMEEGDYEVMKEHAEEEGDEAEEGGREEDGEEDSEGNYDDGVERREDDTMDGCDREGGNMTNLAELEAEIDDNDTMELEEMGVDVDDGDVSEPASDAEGNDTTEIHQPNAEVWKNVDRLKTNELDDGFEDNDMGEAEEPDGKIADSDMEDLTTEVDGVDKVEGLHAGVTDGEMDDVGELASEPEDCRVGGEVGLEVVEMHIDRAHTSIKSSIMGHSDRTVIVIGRRGRSDWEDGMEVVVEESENGADGGVIAESCTEVGDSTPGAYGDGGAGGQDMEAGAVEMSNVEDGGADGGGGVSGATAGTIIVNLLEDDGGEDERLDWSGAEIGDTAERRSEDGGSEHDGEDESGVVIGVWQRAIQRRVRQKTESGRGDHVDMTRRRGIKDNHDEDRGMGNCETG
ncbi:hypothetical protein C8A05DRAFT_38194 [Staphylotrichum tortipilum]|uniref:Uncharacterized protein n=1 Tax=Staphylotrichum tortipilum TaxID=2831512 RepID=A0AAN6MC37_9PEZI|nr:hypothetical protein C8A05DRAFT_38194 [Staphylotrichum longicolle]